jgi:hypothetical protein
LGIWIALDDPSFMHFTHLDEIELFNTSYVKMSSYLIIAGGFGTAMFGILGIVAAATESMKLLATVSIKSKEGSVLLATVSIKNGRGW